MCARVVAPMGFGSLPGDHLCHFARLRRAHYRSNFRVMRPCTIATIATSAATGTLQGESRHAREVCGREPVRSCATAAALIRPSFNIQGSIVR